MKIIDAHMHFSSVGNFAETAANINCKCDIPTLKREFDKCGVVLGVGMGVDSSGMVDGSINPQIITHGLDQFPPFMAQCLGIAPDMITSENREQTLAAYEKLLQEPTSLGFKIYAGYQHYYVDDEVYHPFFRLAEKYNVPVVIHTGDTASSRGKLKYSHPLTVDEAAVDFPDVRFVMAHCGNPWIIDAAEVAMKNPNVYIDLSGLAEGLINAGTFLSEGAGYIEHLKTWLGYMNHYDKLMYGSDWPLVDMKNYIEVIKAVIPEKYHRAVFYDNAVRIFTKLQNYLAGEND